MLDPPNQGGRRAELACLLALLVLYGIAVAAYFVPTTGGPDGNSYHVSARMLEQHGRLYQLPEDEYAFVGRMWVVNERGEYYSKYPPLYPALAGVLMKLFGDRAGLLVNPVSAWLAVLGAYLLCRARLPGWAALLGACVVATMPVLNTFPVDQVSHPPSLATLIWGYALFFHGVRAAGRRRTALLVGAGLVLGVSVGIRYVNVLVTLAPILWCVLRMERTSWKDGAAYLTGLAVPGLILAWYHAASFGSPLATGYSLTNEDRGFALGDLVHNLRFYVPGLVKYLLGPLFLLALGGYVAAWLRDWREGCFYTLWIAPLAGISMSYYFLPESMPVAYMRFLLPVSAPLILLALAFAVQLLSGLGDARLRRAAIAVLFLGQLGWGLPDSLNELELRYCFNDMQFRKLEFIRENAPTGSVVFGPFWLLDALDHDRAYTLRSNELLDQDRLRAQVAEFLADPHVQHRRMAVWKEQLVDVDPETYRQRIRALIDAPLAEGRGVYLMGGRPMLESFDRTYSEFYETESAAELSQLVPRYRLFVGNWGASPSVAWAPLTLTRVSARTDGSR